MILKHKTVIATVNIFMFPILWNVIMFNIEHKSLIIFSYLTSVASPTFRSEASAYDS